MSLRQKPLPYIDEKSRPYWEGAKQHKLMLQKCRECGSFRHPPGEVCPACLSDRVDWVEASGRGSVYTWTVFHQVYHPAFQKDVPYAVVAVELEEGPRLITNLVNCRLEDIAIGMPVEVVFDDVSEEIALPRFRPVRGRPAG